MSGKYNFRKIPPTAELTGEEVRQEMQIAIDAAYQGANPAAQEIFQRLFGDKKPTVEEFIEKVAEEVHRKTDS